jgi:hypothetical protein
MADDPIKQRAQLWEKNLSDLGLGGVALDQLECHKVALSQLHHLKDLYALEGDPDKREKILASAFQLWLLMSAEISEWMLAGIRDFAGLGGVPSIATGGHGDRRHLLHLLMVQEDACGPHRAGFDPAIVILPRQWISEFVEGLKALNYKEVHAIFEPRGTGEHGDAYSWKALKVRAVELVAFLVGKGSMIGRAQDDVAKAAGMSPETLRKYRKEVDPQLIEIAGDAGRLSAFLTSAAKHSEPINPIVLQKMEELEEDDLDSFGKRFRSAPSAPRYTNKSGND